MKNLGVSVFGNCHWVIKGSHDCLKLVERAESQLVRSVNEGVDERKPGLHFLGVALVIGNELGVTSESGCAGHEEVTS